MHKLGTMPSQIIREMVVAGFIKGVREENIRVASLDLSISEELYRVEGVFLPRCKERVRETPKHIGATRHDMINPLECGVTYLARLQETLTLPEQVYGYCNPKSSTGRNDIHVRVMADGVSRYDAAAPAGYSGELWLVIEPRSFPVKLSPGHTLSQMRFFNHDTRFDELELEIAFERYKLLWHENLSLSYGDVGIRDGDGGLILTVNLGGKFAGYECRGLNKVMDFDARDAYRPEEFFNLLPVSDGKVNLKSGSFYILQTREAIRVPPHFSCEVVPMDERSGEFRSHYAGFFDPGWGWGENGEGKGRCAVLELRPFSNMVLRDNQPVAKFRFERMVELPEISYDMLADSSYKNQNGALPRLSRHFKQVA